MADLIGIITASDPTLRNQSLESACAGFSAEELLEQASALDTFRRRSENLYERVRALLFLYDIHRFHLPPKLPADPYFTDHEKSRPRLPFTGYEHLLRRPFEEAIDEFLSQQQEQRPNDL